MFRLYQRRTIFYSAAAFGSFIAAPYFTHRYYADSNETVDPIEEEKIRLDIKAKYKKIYEEKQAMFSKTMISLANEYHERYQKAVEAVKSEMKSSLNSAQLQEKIAKLRKELFAEFMEDLKKKWVNHKKTCDEKWQEYKSLTNEEIAKKIALYKEVTGSLTDTSNIIDSFSDFFNPDWKKLDQISVNLIKIKDRVEKNEPIDELLNETISIATDQPLIYHLLNKVSLHPSHNTQEVLVVLEEELKLDEAQLKEVAEKLRAHATDLENTLAIIDAHITHLRILEQQKNAEKQ